MNKLTLDILLEICADVCQVEAKSIKGRTRPREVVTARQVFCYYAINTMKMRFTDVGKFLDRDHSTIMYSNETAKDRKMTDDLTFAPYFDKVGNILFNEYDSNTVTIVFKNMEQRERFLELCKEEQWTAL